MTATIAPPATTLPSPAEAALADIFSAYNLAYVEVEDTPGNGCELNGYGTDDAWVSLPFDVNEEGCVAGYDWDVYLPLILDEIATKVGRYHTVEGRLMQNPDGTFSFKGNVTKEFEG